MVVIVWLIKALVVWLLKVVIVWWLLSLYVNKCGSIQLTLDPFTFQ